MADLLDELEKLRGEWRKNSEVGATMSIQHRVQAQVFRVCADKIDALITQARQYKEQNDG